MSPVKEKLKARAGPLNLRACDWLRLGFCSDEIISRLMDEGLPHPLAEAIAHRAVRTLLSPEAIRLFQSGLTILRVQDSLIEKGYPRADVFVVVDQLQRPESPSQLDAHAASQCNGSSEDDLPAWCFPVVAEMWLIGVLLAVSYGWIDSVVMHVLGLTLVGTFAWLLRDRFFE